MNTLKADYYASSPNGYIKYKDVEVDLVTPRRQLQVYSVCNEILPYQLHPIQVMPSKQLQSQNQQLNNYSQPMTNQEKQRPSNIMQRQQVLSVHIDQKKNNSKFAKTQKKQIDLTRSSTITAKNMPKSILKHSMNQIESTIKNGGYQKYYKKQMSERSTTLLTQVEKQRLLRQNLQQKYQKLLQTLIKNKLVNENQTKRVDQDRLSEDMQKTKYKLKYHLIDKNQKQNSWQQMSSQKQCHQTFRKEQSFNCKNHFKNCPLAKNENLNSSTTALSVFMLSRLQNDIKQIKNKIQRTHQLINQQQLNCEHDKIMNQLNQKDKQIEYLQNHNQKLKQQASKVKSSNQEHSQLDSESKTHIQVALGQKLFKIQIGKKQSFLIGFILALLALLIMSSFRSIVC